MAESRIDSVINVPAIQAEFDATKKGIADLVAQIKAVKDTGLNIAGVKTAKEYAALRKELDLLIKQTNASAKAAIDEAKVRTQTAKAVQAEAKARTQTAKAKQIEEKYTNQLIKAKETLNKKAIKEADKLGKLNNAYEQLKFKELQAANTAKALASQYGIYNKVTQDAIAVQARYYTQLIAIEKAVGQNQRNVGNYTQATFALTQVIREAPAFANSFATGISGISNNIPILVDEIKKLNAANKELAANGLKTIPVFSTLAKSLLSLNGILPIAFLLLQTVGKNLFKAADGADYAKEKIDALNKSFQKQQDILNKANTREDLFSGINDEILRKAGKSEDEILKKRLESRNANALRLRQLEISAGKELTDEKERQSKIQLAIEDISGKSLSKKAKENLKSVLDAAQKNFDDATTARENYNLETVKLVIGGEADIADAQRDAAKKAAEERKKSAEDAAKEAIEIAERNRQATFDIQKVILQQEIDFNKQVSDSEKSNVIDRELALRAYSRAKTNLILLTADFEMATAGKTSKELQLIEFQRSDELLRLRRETDAQLNKIGEDFREQTAKDEEKLKDELTKIAEKGFEDWKKIQDKKDVERRKREDKEKEDAKKLAEDKTKLEQQLVSEITTLAFTALTANIERQKNALQEQLDQLEINKAREIELAGGNADAIAVIEARAAVQRETIQRKQRDLDIKKAQFDKAQSIARIVQETAIAIVSALARPGGAALIPLIAALGATQLATVIATPIPKYKDGTEDHKGGLMIVGDGGKSEGITFPDGTTMKSPATDTLMYAPKGTKVHPDFSEMMFNATMTKVPQFNSKTVSDSSVKVVKGLKAVEKAIGKIPQQSITVENILRKRVRYGSSINNHISRNTGA